MIKLYYQYTFMAVKQKTPGPLAQTARVSRASVVGRPEASGPKKAGYRRKAG